MTVGRFPRIVFTTALAVLLGVGAGVAWAQAPTPSGTGPDPEAPIARPDDAVVPVDADEQPIWPIWIDVLANDSDPGGTAVRITGIGVVYGTAAVDQHFTDDPSDDEIVYTGRDGRCGKQIYYEITNELGLSSVTSVWISFAHRKCFSGGIEPVPVKRPPDRTDTHAQTAATPESSGSGLESSSSSSTASDDSSADESSSGTSASDSTVAQPTSGTRPVPPREDPTDPDTTGGTPTGTGAATSTPQTAETGTEATGITGGPPISIPDVGTDGGGSSAASSTPGGGGATTRPSRPSGQAAPASEFGPPGDGLSPAVLIVILVVGACLVAAVLFGTARRILRG